LGSAVPRPQGLDKALGPGACQRRGAA